MEQAQSTAAQPLEVQSSAAQQLNPKQRKLAYYLANNVKPMQAASICGVTPGYLSQLMTKAKEDQAAGRANLFAQAIQEYKDEAGAEDKEQEQLKVRYLAIEHKVLDSIENSVASGTLNEQIRALQVIADVQDKRLKAAAPPASSPGGVQVHITQITIPQHALAAPQVQMDSQQRIIAVDNKPMAALTGQQVRGLFASMRAQGQEQNQVAISVQNAIMESSQPNGLVIEGAASRESSVSPEDF